MNGSAFRRELTQAGCVIKRRGGNHDIWLNPRNGKLAPVPRHPRIGDSLCDLIRKQLGLK